MTTVDATFKIKHTRGDTLSLSLGILNEDNSSFNWATEGYSSAICSVKQIPSMAPVLTLTTSIATTGTLVLLSPGVVTLEVGLYVYDIQFTKSDGSKETWFTDSPCTLEITQDIT